MNQALTQEVTIQEIQEATFSMGKLKSPGPDRFSGAFYQTHWNVIKDDIVIMVKDFFSSSRCQGPAKPS